MRHRNVPDTAMNWALISNTVSVEGNTICCFNFCYCNFEVVFFLWNAILISQTLLNLLCFSLSLKIILFHVFTFLAHYWTQRFSSSGKISSDVVLRCVSERHRSTLLTVERSFWNWWKNRWEARDSSQHVRAERYALQHEGEVSMLSFGQCSGRSVTFGTLGRLQKV